MPAASLAAVGPGLMLLGHDRCVPAVEELQHQEEHLVADRVDRYDPGSGGGGRPGRRAVVSKGSRGGGRRTCGRRVGEGGCAGGVGAAEELAEEEAAGREDAAVGVDEAALDAEGDVAEGLAVDEEVEVVKGEGSQGVFRGHN